MRQRIHTEEAQAPEIAGYPMLPLRDMVLFPGAITPIYAGRPQSLAAIRAAKDGMVFILAQKDPNVNDPKTEDLYAVGILAKLLQQITLEDGTVKILVTGQSRARAQSLVYDEQKKCYFAMVSDFETEDDLDEEGHDAYANMLYESFNELAKQLGNAVPKGLPQAILGQKTLEDGIDAAMAYVEAPTAKRQEILEEPKLSVRADMTMARINELLSNKQLSEKIQKQVKKQMDKNQREYFLNEQMKVIQKELGNDDMDDFEELARKIDESGMSEEASAKAKSELKKLRQMAPMSAEATVVRGYLDALLALPWKEKSEVSSDITKAAKILDEDHYGLEKVKERILEYLAVQSRVDRIKAPILCLVGAPGVGKTSLGQSIARATNRRYIRMALGGVRDEAEIRGHRRTYIGSMPGKIIQSITKSGVKNPFFLLDEIDKMGMDQRGDPASALLEVLDPEQNHTFQDHYIEVDYDLSEVMFVATSNSLNIPQALLDRMEVIHLSGYTEDEKLNIATRHLIPKQFEANGIGKTELTIAEEAIVDIIRYYTREAGVRGLEREIGKICRKVVRSHLMQKAQGEFEPVTVDAKNLSKFLGVRRFSFGVAHKESRIGEVNGLAWTEVGGDILSIEAAVFPGKGQVQRTGSLGDVMKESVEAARSVVRARADSLGIDPELFGKTDWHLHFPEGATPKDGPSAGGAITTAMVSAITKIPVRPDVAMTGEITLHGEILEIGGLKEKLLAALRAGIKTVMIPRDNMKDLEEIPQNVKDGLEIIPVKWIEEILPVALTENPFEAAQRAKPTLSAQTDCANA